MFTAADILERTISVGDDIVKDGQLAKDSGVKNFSLITPETSVDVWKSTARWLGIDYTAIAINGIVRRNVSK